MADYCSLAEALALLPSVGILRDAVAYSAGPPIVAAVTATVPSATQAAALLASVTAELDMHLRGRGYATPAVDTEALASLKTICMNGTAARIAKSMWPGGTGAGGDSGAVTTLREDYAAGIAFIDRGGLATDSTASGTSFADGFDHDRCRDERWEAPY
jgi:poly(3-hydroxybutyrate) depolymerase